RNRGAAGASIQGSARKRLKVEFLHALEEGDGLIVLMPNTEDRCAGPAARFWAQDTADALSRHVQHEQHARPNDQDVDRGRDDFGLRAAHIHEALTAQRAPDQKRCHQRKHNRTAPSDQHEQNAGDALRHAGANVEERRADGDEAVKLLALGVAAKAPFQQHGGVVGDVAAVAVADNVNAVVLLVEAANAVREFVGAALAIPGAVRASPEMRNDFGVDAMSAEMCGKPLAELRAALKPLL